MIIYPQNYDVIVIGGGHAGCEASLACARMGLKTLLLTMNLDTIAQMSCNPAIGGIAKGQMVREIDALGGEIAKNTDKTGIMFKMLNTSKGPAVHSPRAQCDRKLYQFTMKNTLEKQENLEIRQAEVVKILVSDSKVSGVLTRSGTAYNSKAVIVTTGTFLNGVIHIGLKSYPAGRAGEFPSVDLANSLLELGFELKRFKTSTPPRINSRSVDFSKSIPQYSDEPPIPFSHFTEKITQKMLNCWITYTNETTHKIIRDNLDRSPMYAGKTIGIEPRYCPSIEDKVVRFPDKERHQVFLEPEGYNTLELYCNGLFSGLPEDVQEKVVRSLAGCENAEITRYGYAIEYDFCPPTQLKPTLETKLIENLFFAGQINGTTGYEEAAAQGLVAGINAALKIKDEEPFILRRDEAYIGVLIDDLVTKGVMDPYRMFTSRAEFRLILRNDNADLRLMDYGYKFGLINEETYKKFCRYREIINKEMEKVERDGIAQYIRRGMRYHDAVKIAKTEPLICDDEISPWDDEKIIRQVEIQIKYDGYIRHQLQEVERFRKLENKRIPEDFDYDSVRGLLEEARLKLKQIKPLTIGQASRISGVTPADISILLVYLTKRHYGVDKKF